MEDHALRANAYPERWIHIRVAHAHTVRQRIRLEEEHVERKEILEIQT